MLCRPIGIIPVTLSKPMNSLTSPLPIARSPFPLIILAPYFIERLCLLHSKLQNVLEYVRPEGGEKVRFLELRLVTLMPIEIANVLISSRRYWLGDSKTIHPGLRKNGFADRRYPSASQKPSITAIFSRLGS